MNLRASRPGRRAFTLLLPAVLTALLAVFAAAPHAQEGETGEYRIKAAFLYKFGSYIDWPEHTFSAPESPFVIGVMGSEPVAQDLDQMVADRTVADRRVEVRRLAPGDPIVDVQVLFVGREVAAQADEVLAAAEGLPILTVTELEDRAEQPSVINFVVAGNKVRFDVALARARTGQLKISARLLAVARTVRNGES